MAKPDAITPIKKSGKVSALIHGNPSSGKTRFIGTGGKGTLIVRPPTEHTDSIRIPGADEWVVNDHAEFSEVQDFMRQGGDKEYDWVWLDSISLFQDHGLDDIWADVLAAKPQRGKFDVDKGEYGINMARLGRWVRHMVGLPGFNFGITAHSFEYEKLDGRLWPWVQGARMPEKICGYMNVVGYLEVTQGKRVMRFSESEGYFAKDQFDAFAKGRLVEPDMDKFMAKITSAREGAESSATTTRRKPRRKRSPK